MVNSGYIAALYPQLNIDAMKEVRPVETEFRRIDSELSILLLRLPESDQVKSNVKRITIDYASILDQPRPEELNFEVCNAWNQERCYLPSIPNEKIRSE